MIGTSGSSFVRAQKKTVSGQLALAGGGGGEGRGGGGCLLTSTEIESKSDIFRTTLPTWQSVNRFASRWIPPCVSRCWTAAHKSFDRNTPPC